MHRIIESYFHLINCKSSFLKWLLGWQISRLPYTILLDLLPFRHSLWYIELRTLAQRCAQEKHKSHMKSIWGFSKGITDFGNRKTNISNGHRGTKINLRNGRLWTYQYLQHGLREKWENKCYSNSTLTASSKNEIPRHSWRHYRLTADRNWAPMSEPGPCKAQACLRLHWNSVLKVILKFM